MNDYLGKLITSEQAKDAIHIAIAPVTAAEKLSPGDHVGLNADGLATEMAEPIGVVDPFLKKVVRPGEKFWLLLYPNTITALRHEWTHPAFAVAAADTAGPIKSDSEAWIRAFAARIPLDYDTVMGGAHDYIMSIRGGGYGEYLNFGSLLEDECVPEEFWPHYEAVTGESVAEAERGSFFSCSC
jgi:hypothetical protein